MNARDEKQMLVNFCAAVATWQQWRIVRDYARRQGLDDLAGVKAYLFVARCRLRQEIGGEVIPFPTRGAQ